MSKIYTKNKVLEEHFFLNKTPLQTSTSRLCKTQFILLIQKHILLVIKLPNQFLHIYHQNDAYLHVTGALS